MLKRIEPEEVLELLDSDSGYIYLDVRSPEEYQSGHVPGSLNIPLLERNPSGVGMVPNPAFLDQVDKTFEKDAKLIVGCQRGARSVKAAQLLLDNGFENVLDMRGGFDGEVDPTGDVTYPGWARRGLPTTGSGGA